MEQQQAKSIIESLTQSIRRSVTVKLLSIFILMLLLMIPMAFVSSLIEERDALRESAIHEVSDKWANEQYVYGPILTIPYYVSVLVDGKEKKYKNEAHILPSGLNIDGAIDPKSLRRGIYEVVVYDSKISFDGSFSNLSKYTDELSDNEILWEEAFLTINITDLRGIKEKIVLNWNGTEKQIEPGSAIPSIIKSGVTVSDIFSEKPDTNAVKFSFDLNLQGSQHLGFIPLGKETHVTLNSKWKDPSFAGSFLPDNRTVNEDGFTAQYTVLELNRNYPQFWKGNINTENISNSAFGVDLLLPMNDYQKAMRSAKYALLAISLTFLTFFLVEIFSRKEVHPFQYILIGLALTLFYTLLVSISEHMNFDIAYLISSISVISMIGLYSKSILHNIRETVLLVVILCCTYAFVYITLQIQDYALLIGSIGLTSILALTMFITRNINWYELGATKKTDTSLS